MADLERWELEMELNDGLGSMPNPKLIELVGSERAWALHSQKQAELFGRARFGWSPPHADGFAEPVKSVIDTDGEDVTNVRRLERKP